MAYDRGDSVRSTATFTVGAVATDPTTVVVRLLAPRREVVSYQYGVGATIVKTGTGVYYADVTLDVGGMWRIRWEGTGACISAIENEISVDKGAF